MPHHLPRHARSYNLLTIFTGNDDAYYEVKKPSQEQLTGPGFVIGGVDTNARVAHLEHSVRFLQEQHRLMLSGLHNEIEALRERNRDLQFQLIFNKESSRNTAGQAAEENVENPEETDLRRECVRLEREAAAARGEARAAEGRSLQLQRVIDAQTLKLRDLELKSELSAPAEPSEAAESRGELRARLASAERLVRRLRADADRQRREVPGGVTNLLFDGAHNRHAHLQCMKNSLHASIRASQIDSYGYQNTYSFPTLQHSPTEYWTREPVRDTDCIRAPGRTRRPLTLPELTAQQVQRATIYANAHARPRANYEQPRERKRPQHLECAHREHEDPVTVAPHRLVPKLGDDKTKNDNCKPNFITTYPELKVVVTRMIPHGNVSQGEPSRPRARRPHRKHAPDHT